MTGPPEQRNFFASLFDFKFVSLIATRFAKVIYVIGVVFISLDALSNLVVFGRLGGGWFVIGIVFAAISWLIQMIFWRILLEFMIVFFRIGDDVRRIAGSTVGLQAYGRVPGSQPSASPLAPTTVPATTMAPPPPAMVGSYCGSCGSALAPGARVCPTCNSPVAS